MGALQIERCLSVDLSVLCRVPRHNSRRERPRKPKFGRLKAHHTWNLEVKKSKVKVTRPTNGHTINAQYLPKWKAYELQTWYTDGARRSTSSTGAMTSKVKVKVAMSRDASGRCWPISREWNVTETPKLMGRLYTLQAIMRTSFKVKDPRSVSPGRLMLRLEVRHIFRTGRPTNFKLGIRAEYENPHQRQAPWPPRSKIKVALVTWGVWQVLADKSRTKRPRNTKIGGRLPCPPGV